jgi:hypothetical protein
VAKVEKAVLSTTAKAKERQKKKDAEKQSKSGAAPGKAAGEAEAVAASWGVLLANLLHGAGVVLALVHLVSQKSTSIDG